MLHARHVIPVLVLLWCSCSSATPTWWLWESPNDDTEVLDQAQTVWTNQSSMTNGHGVGQSFTPQQDRLYRLDLILSNRNDRRPFTIRLWSWIDADGEGDTDNGEYAATVAQLPLWEDTGRVPGRSDPTLVVFYPDEPVTPGQPYYFEIGNLAGDGEWGFFGTWNETDPYPGGQLRVADYFRSVPPTGLQGDLFFRTYGSPEGAPAPLECAGTSLPAPCVSDSGPWQDPDPYGAPVDRADYLAIVQSKAEAQRDATLAGNGQHASRFAMYDACLYRATGDEAHVDHALALFEKAMDHRRANPDEGVPFMWMERPGWAYTWIRDSPTLTPADHDLIQTLLLHTAAGAWRDRQLGLFNHAFGYALTSKHATELIDAGSFAALSVCRPDGAGGCEGPFRQGEQLTAADHAAWRAHADDNWNEFKATWDFAEDSNTYQMYDLHYVLQLAMLYGEEATIWQVPEFRALVERMVAFHTPLGPSAVFGDTYGWNMFWGTGAWIFEEAAARLQDPHYKWHAERLYDYQRTHLADLHASGTPIELWQGVYNEYSALCHAYFSVDPDLQPIAPPEQREVAAARQDVVDTVPWTAAAGGIGQTFRPAASPLTRLDVALRNSGDTSPVTLQVWQWAGSHAATVGQTPVFADGTDLPGLDVVRVHSFHPFLEVEVGTTYYFEIERAAPFESVGSGGPDAYADGALWRDGAEHPEADLWFRTTTLTPHDSTHTTRRKIVNILASQQGTPPRYHVFADAWVPSKLVLRSGWHEDDLHAVVNLLPPDYGHAQAETGGIVSLTDDGAVILAGSNYFDRLPRDQSVPVTKRHQGATRTGEESEVDVARFADYRNATVAWIDWTDPYGWDVDHQRRFYFVKNAFLLVRDRTTFGSSTLATTGNIWHSYDVHPTLGSSWFGLYDRQPLGVNGWLFDNPERYALLYLVPRLGVTTVQWRAPYEGNPPSAPYIAGQKWVGPASGGTDVWLDSLLVPHGPDEGPADVATGIWVRHDDGVAIALDVVIDGETWTVVDNPHGGTVAAADLLTDASYLIARTGGERPPYLLVDGATVATVDTLDFSWPTPVSAEIGGAADETDGDGDGVPDVADNCVFDVNPDQDDSDGDGSGSVCDGCPDTPDSSQTDIDADGEGDRCDVDDGLIFLAFDAVESVAWQDEAGFDAWNLYRGDIEVLGATGVYTQAPGSNDLAGRTCGLPGPGVEDTVVPSTGAVAFYLVTGSDGGVESGLGQDGSGQPRPNTLPCP